MFETDAELKSLQSLLDSSFDGAGGGLAGFSRNQRMSARQLAGFSGVRLVSVASSNSKLQPRVSPRSAAFLHGRFYLASSPDSTTARRLRARPDTAVAYYERRLLVMGHGRASFLGKEEPAYTKVAKEWKLAFRGGPDSLSGAETFIVVEATHLVAFAASPERYPKAWASQGRDSRHVKSSR